MLTPTTAIYFGAQVNYLLLLWRLLFFRKCCAFLSQDWRIGGLGCWRYLNLHSSVYGDGWFQEVELFVGKRDDDPKSDLINTSMSSFTVSLWCQSLSLQHSFYFAKYCCIKSKMEEKFARLSVDSRVFPPVSQKDHSRIEATQFLITIDPYGL